MWRWKPYQERWTHRNAVFSSVTGAVLFFRDSCVSSRCISIIDASPNVPKIKVGAALGDETSYC
ncbi:hypothetical protein [Chlorogloeopsis sp. ULAP02]|uniref:hypothetical protein n=1 Tax=Chlorogloeopsis sp. ULAP02 TaxID=3107926 RepID=UPI00398B5EE2